MPINAVTGQFVDAKRLIRRDNTFLGKVDLETGRGRLSVTASRIRPYARDPSALIGNDNTFQNASKRASTQYVFTTATWVSESRFGWNNSTFDRYPEFWVKESPTRGPQSVLSSAEKRIGSISISGLFSTPNTELVQMDYNSFNFDQKVTRIMAGHAVKFGFRWSRDTDRRPILRRTDTPITTSTTCWRTARVPSCSRWGIRRIRPGSTKLVALFKTTGGSTAGWWSTWV